MGTTRVAYMTGTLDPWSAAEGGSPTSGPGSPNTAMNDAFGAANWTKIQGFTAAAFDGRYDFIYLNGSGFDRSEFLQFITANVATIENFVSNGGRLFINSAGTPIEAYQLSDTFSVGFGASLQSGWFAKDAYAVDP